MEFRTEFKKVLPECVDFIEDLKNGTGKPHEAMSALVGLEMLRQYHVYMLLCIVVSRIHPYILLLYSPQKDGLRLIP